MDNFLEIREECLDTLYLLDMIVEHKLEIRRRYIYEGRPQMLLDIRMLKNLNIEQLKKGLQKFITIFEFRYYKLHKDYHDLDGS